MRVEHIPIVAGIVQATTHTRRKGDELVAAARDPRTDPDDLRRLLMEAGYRQAALDLLVDYAVEVGVLVTGR